jgi:hypothetical protein
MRKDEAECLGRVYEAYKGAFGPVDGPLRYFSGMGGDAAWFGDKARTSDEVPIEIPDRIAREAWIFTTIKEMAWHTNLNKIPVLVAVCTALDNSLERAK